MALKIPRVCASGSNMTLQAYWDRYQLIGDSNYRNARWNTFDVDFQHQFMLGTRQKVVWGLGYRHISATLNNSGPDSGFSLSWLENNPQSETFSGFLQDEITIVPDRLAITLATKLEHNSYTGWEAQPSARLLWTPTKRQSIWTAVRMAMSGDFTLGQIAQACGRSRSAVGQWMRVAREQGLAALMGLHQGRGRSSAIRGKVKNEMLKGLARGRWKRRGDIARWLRERHGVEMGIGGVGYHVGKCGVSPAGAAPDSPPQKARRGRLV